MSEYTAGSTQVELAAKYNLTQVAISKILRREGSSGRDHRTANPPTFDIDKASALYVSGLSAREVGEAVGISSSVLLGHLRRRGVTREPGGVQVYKGFNREFFEVVDPLRAYWAGFIAADGSLHKNTVSFGLHVDDRDMLEKLKKAALLPHPIDERPNNKGGMYAWMAVTCREWVRDLFGNFKLTPKKSLTLQPPDLSSEVDAWAYIRGYFDGDGHARADGSCLQFTCGSLPFLTWVVRGVFKAPHKIYPLGESWGCYISGPIFRSSLMKLYAGSTPDTRMARKYDRFVAGGFVL